jgi:hypothetical protein
MPVSVNGPSGPTCGRRGLPLFFGELEQPAGPRPLDPRDPLAVLPDRIVDELVEVERLRTAGVEFRNNVVKGPGGSQILLEDPSGNPVELFQPR